MTKAEWGTKRTCPKCNAPFYDLRKNPVQCPKCQHSYDPEKQVSKKGRKKAEAVLPVKDKAQAKVKKRELVEEDEDAIDLPELESLDIMDDIEDMENVDVEAVGGVKSKPSGSANEDEEDEEAFLEDDIADEEDLLDLPEHDDELILEEDELEEEKPAKPKSKKS